MCDGSEPAASRIACARDLDNATAVHLARSDELVAHPGERFGDHGTLLWSDLLEEQSAHFRDMAPYRTELLSATLWRDHYLDGTGIVSADLAPDETALLHSANEM